MPEPCQRVDGGGHHVVIDADGAGGDRGQAERLEDVGAHGLARLGAEPPHAALGVVTGERREVDERDGAGEPRGLVRLFHRAPPGQGCRAALDGRGVGLHARNPVEVERHAGIARLVKLRQLPVVSVCIDCGRSAAGSLRSAFGGILRRRSHAGASMASLTKWSNFEASGSEPRQDQSGCDQPDAASRVQLTSRKAMPKAPVGIKDRRRGKLAEDEGGNQRDDAESADGRRSGPDVDAPSAQPTQAHQGAADAPARLGNPPRRRVRAPSTRNATRNEIAAAVIGPPT
jgi:hypothetical protein